MLAHARECSKFSNVRRERRPNSASGERIFSRHSPLSNTASGVEPPVYARTDILAHLWPLQITGEPVGTGVVTGELGAAAVDSGVEVGVGETGDSILGDGHLVIGTLGISVVGTGTGVGETGLPVAGAGDTGVAVIGSGVGAWGPDTSASKTAKCFSRIHWAAGLSAR